MNERTIFLEAVEKKDPAEREAFLAATCGGDTALRQRIENLLRSHREAGAFLGSPVLGPEVAATPGSRDETQATGVDSKPSEVALDFLAPSELPWSLGRLDHHEVLEVVGRGGMGVVLRVFDNKLHRFVALKVMAREIAGNAAARKRFNREAKAAAAVVHDHIVPIHAIEEAGPTPYLVMQYIAGQSLQQKIDAEGSLELKEILRIGTQIASGLAAAHKQGLVHRDIKPSNILLENGVQRVKITDFGLARAIDDASLSQTGVVTGTPQYMSPEQADGRAVDHRSDLFSLGSVMYAMCTGRPPFRAASTLATLKRVCEETPRPIGELNPDLPDWLGDIIAKLQAKKPEERFQNAKEVAELLEARLASAQWPSANATPRPQQPPVPAPIAPRRRRWPAVVAIALLAAILGAWAISRNLIPTFQGPAIKTDNAGPGEIAELKRLVALQGKSAENSRIRFQAGMESAADVAAAEINLIEVRVRLAEALKQTQDVERLLGELVRLREEQLNFMRIKYEAQTVTQAEVDQAEQRLIEARLRAGKAAANSAGALDGRWRAVGAEYQGRKVTDAEMKEMVPTEMILKGDQFGITWSGKQHEGSFRVDATKSPAEVDFNGTIFGGLKPRAMIYKLEGDRLTLCLPLVEPNGLPPRPTAFTSDPQSKNAVLIFERVRSQPMAP